MRADSYFGRNGTETYRMKAYVCLERPAGRGMPEFPVWIQGSGILKYILEKY